MKNYNIPSPKVNVLYSKEIGRSMLSEIALLQSLPWVNKVIVVEYLPMSLDSLVQHYLNMDVDCIFVAGSEYDPSEKYCNERTKRINHDERRETFELKLITAAKNKGIPLLAVCAGSWRLCNAYGAKTYAVDENIVTQHENWQTARHPDNLTYLKSGSMLQQIHVSAQRNKEIIFSQGKAVKVLGRSRSVNTNYAPLSLNVNTTHWRVSPAPETQYGTEFRNVFETCAIDTKHFTVEGYESKQGAPTIGVQFHPEYVIPEVRKNDGTSVIVEDYKTHRSILDSLITSGVTFSRKRQIDANKLEQQRSQLRTVKKKRNYIMAKM